jgi:hypothetical protein
MLVAEVHPQTRLEKHFSSHCRFKAEIVHDWLCSCKTLSHSLKAVSI